MPLSKKSGQIEVAWSVSEVSPLWGDLTVSEVAWLSERERRILAEMRFSKRRKEWLAGRWTAKQMLLRCLSSLAGRSMATISIENHPNGYPLVLVEGQPLPGCVSISHRAEKAAAAYVAEEDTFIGIDLEWIEERHPAFLQDYFTANEIEWVGSASPQEQSARTTLLWSAKESALKVLRLGLAVDTRMIEVKPWMMEADEGGWRMLIYRSNLLEEGKQLLGWWQQRGNYMLTLAAHLPTGEIPRIHLREVHLIE